MSDLTLDEIKVKSRLFNPVGSRVTCNPAPTGTDEDYLIMVAPDEFAAFEAGLLGSGYEMGGSRVLAGGCALGDPDSFQSYTKGEINLIVTTCGKFFVKFMAATSVAKRLNLLDKSDRIALFQAVLYGAFDGSPYGNIA